MAALPDGVILQGWATKLGAKVKTWRRRYFVVYQGERRLRYYSPSVNSTTAARVRPKGHIAFTADTKLLAEAECMIQWPAGHDEGCGIGIETPSRTYYITCDKPAAAREWLQVMAAEIAKIPSSGLASLTIESSDDDEISSPPRSMTLQPRAAEPRVTQRHASYSAATSSGRLSTYSTASSEFVAPDPAEASILVEPDHESMTKAELIDLVKSLKAENEDLREQVKALSADGIGIPMQNANRAVAIIPDGVGVELAEAAIIIQAWWRRTQLAIQFRKAKAQALDRIRLASEGAITRKSMVGVGPASRKPSCAMRRPSGRKSFRASLSVRRMTFGGAPLVPTPNTDGSLDPDTTIISEDVEPELQLQHRVALYLFNKRPHKYLHLLDECGMISIDDPSSIAKFIYEQRGINRGMIGDFLGDNNPVTASVLTAFAREFDFSGCTLDQSLRLFLFSFRIPGEAQKIERVVETFARRFHECNPDLFQHEDTAFVMAFSVLMLQTDLHNPSNPRKMTKDEFVRNNRGIDDGADLPAPYLYRIYERIQSEEFQVCLDHTFIVETVAARIVGKHQLITPERAYVGELSATELFKTGQPRPKRVVTLLLFNDVLVVAGKSKWDRKKCTLRKEIPLFGTKLEPFDGYPDSFDLMRDGESHLRFQVDKNNLTNVDDIREYISQCEAIAAITEAPKQTPSTSSPVKGTEEESNA